MILIVFILLMAVASLIIKGPEYYHAHRRLHVKPRQEVWRAGCLTAQEAEAFSPLSNVIAKAEARAEIEYFGAPQTAANKIIDQGELEERQARAQFMEIAKGREHQ